MSSRTNARRARVRKQLFRHQRGRCCWCSCQMEMAGDPYAPTFATIEHLVPRAHGGTNARTNLALACRHCNLARGSPSPVITTGPSETVGAMEVAFQRAGLVPA